MVTFKTGETIEIVDTFCIYQKDIILNEEQLEWLSEPDTPDGTDETVSTRGNVLNYDKYKWKGDIRFFFDRDFKEPYRTYVYEAIAEWKRACPFLNFVDYDHYSGILNFDCINFYHASDNSSFSSIGKQGGCQNISIAKWGNKGTAMHEIGHALGLLHEHSRKDRDEFIIVDYDNIHKSERADYDKTSSKLNTITVHGLSATGSGHIATGTIETFDFNSLMLYSSWPGPDTAINPSNPVMRRKNNNQPFNRQRDYIGSIDRLSLFSFYGKDPFGQYY